MNIIKSVLVVDDSGINRLLPGLILRPFGWTVFEADGGASALEMLKHVKVSCVLLDISMPEIGGMQVLNDLRRNSEFDTIKIIAYTAYANASDTAYLKSLGFNAVLLKPITSRKLLETLRF